MSIFKDSIGPESLSGDNNVVGGGGSSFGGTPLPVGVPLVLFLATSYHLVMNTLLGRLAFIIVAWLLFMFPHL
jgi:hypothetical protein